MFFNLLENKTDDQINTKIAVTTGDLSADEKCFECVKKSDF